MSHRAIPRCPICQDDGWYADPSFADAEKKIIRIRKVACPNGCPNKDNEPGVAETNTAAADALMAIFGLKRVSE